MCSMSTETNSSSFGVTRRVHDEARRHPERETLLLAAAGAAKVLGADHGATKALARASVPHRKTSQN